MASGPSHHKPNVPRARGPSRPAVPRKDQAKSARQSATLARSTVAKLWQQPRRICPTPRAKPRPIFRLRRTSAARRIPQIGPKIIRKTGIFSKLRPQNQRKNAESRRRPESLTIHENTANFPGRIANPGISLLQDKTKPFICKLRKTQVGRTIASGWRVSVPGP